MKMSQQGKNSGQSQAEYFPAKSPAISQLTWSLASDLLSEMAGFPTEVLANLTENVWMKIHFERKSCSLFSDW